MLLDDPEAIFTLTRRVAVLESALTEIESKPYRAEEVIARLRAGEEVVTHHPPNYPDGAEAGEQETTA
jgi:hypothetical protein